MAKPESSPSSTISETAISVALGASWLSRGLRRARQLSGVAPLLATSIALAALGTSMAQLQMNRRATQEQNMGEVMRQSSQLLMWAAADPKAFAYIERDLYNNGQARSLDELRREDHATRMKVQLLCETLADFFESTYDRRDSFDTRSWSDWWGYLTDVYAESPVLRDFLRSRGAWYDVDEALEATLPTLTTRQLKHEGAIRR